MRERPSVAKAHDPFSDSAARLKSGPSQTAWCDASVESHPSAKDALGWAPRGAIRAGPDTVVYNPQFPISLRRETIR